MMNRPTELDTHSILQHICWYSSILQWTQVETLNRCIIVGGGIAKSDTHLEEPWVLVRLMHNAYYVLALLCQPQHSLIPRSWVWSKPQDYSTPLSVLPASLAFI